MKIRPYQQSDNEDVHRLYRKQTAALPFHHNARRDQFRTDLQTTRYIRNPADHLVCYQAKLARKFIAQSGCGPADPTDKGTNIEPKQPKHTKRTGIFVNNQFGPEQLDTQKEVAFCIPSNKNPVCGDGILQSLAGEECDDGNTLSGDGCSEDCTQE